MLSLDDYVVDVLMRDLVGHDRRPVAFLVYLWLAAEQGREERRKEAPRGDDRRGDDAVQVSYQAMAESIGVSKSSVQAAVSWLARRKLIAVSKQNATATPRYRVMSPWRERRKGR
jgi:hypothetical protein